MSVTACSVDCLLTSTLADIQQAIWHDQLARLHSPVYNIGGRLAIYGEVNYALLKQALQQLVDQNQALRLDIVQSNDQTWQSVRPAIALELPFIDFSKADDPDTAAANWLQEQFEKPFSMEEGCIYWQFALVKISRRQFALLTKYHHLFADGWSTKVVIDRLAELYNALLLGTEPTPAQTATYFDYVAQENQYLHSALFERDAAFWQMALPAPPEPLIRQKYPVQGHFQATRANIHRFSIDRVFYDRLQQWAERQQSTLYHVLLSALSVYFARAQQQQRLTVGIPALNRNGARFKKVLGMFASMSPLVVDIDIGTTAQQLLRQITTGVRQVHKHQRYPLGALRRRLPLLKKQRASLFDLVLSYERQDYSVHFGDAAVQARQLFSGFALYPLAVTVCEFSSADAVEVVFEGAETCFNIEELTLLAQRLQWVLQQFIEFPERLLQDIDLVPAAEKQIIFQQFNSPQTPPAFVSAIKQFHDRVNNTPDAPAVSQHDRQLTYRMLDSLSHQLALDMLQRQVVAGDVVAVCMPRCIEAIIALVAIFKIRGVYLPLDIDCPKQRLVSILQQSQAQALLVISSAGDLGELLSNSLYVDRVMPAEQPQAVAFIEPQADDLAYLIYTSGSSGQPKAAKIPHRALAVRLAWLQKTFAIQTHERVGQSIQTHFDPSLIEIFLALTQGAELVLAPWQRLQADDLADFVLRQNINALALVPSSLRLLLQGLPDIGAVPLRVVCCGGEILPASLAKAFIGRTGAQLLNVYGPTETTILATAWDCGIDDADILPIGRPLDDTQILIVDRQLKLLPVAVSGEIVIGGAGVGQGYLGQPTLSSQVFTTNPYADQANAELYRSGDCGYIGTDGQLYFAERLDRQVKISGYRIEPAEIENLLIQHPAVQRAAVDVMTVHAQKLLMAFVEADIAHSETLQHELADYLRQRLPDYMQPRMINVLDNLPLTPIGKIDYAQLPVPDCLTTATTQRAPATELETQLLMVWQQTLKNPHVGVEDNFFAQDTDSLTAISLIVAIEKLTGYRQSIGFLMAYPTVAAQAEQLAQTQVPACQPDYATLSHSGHQVDFYMAASGYGDQLRFQALADALGRSCTLHILYPPQWTLEQASIEAIASEYARVIRENSQKAFYLGGFSIGGITALETARQLEQQGFAPLKLILLDSVYPRGPLQSPWLFKTLQWLSGLLILNQISVNGRKLQAMLADPGIIVQLAALNRHVIRPYSGATVLLMSKPMRWLRRWLFSGWYSLLNDNLQSDQVSGLHGAMFRPRHLPKLTQVLKRCLRSQ